MGLEFKVDVQLDSNKIEKKINSLFDETLMLQIHSLFERYCEPYVPYLNGPLSRTTDVTAERVRYTQPYAHYQYVGVDFNHTLNPHPKATAYWDKVMMTEMGEQFCDEVYELIHRRAKELYG